MKQTERKNPYFAEQGCENHHEMAITGYGITLDTIKYWLFEKQLEPEIKFSKDAITALKDSDYSIQEIKEISDDGMLSTAIGVHQYLIQFCTFSNRDDEILMVYGQPIRDEDDKTLLPTRKEVIDNIMIAIPDIFDVPSNKLPELKKFITEHTDYINVTDYS